MALVAFRKALIRSNVSKIWTAALVSHASPRSIHITDLTILSDPAGRSGYPQGSPGGNGSLHETPGANGYPRTAPYSHSILLSSAATDHITVHGFGVRSFIRQRERFSTSSSHTGNLRPAVDGVLRGGPLQVYQQLIAEGELIAGDSHQEEAVQNLQGLYDVLIGMGETAQNERFRIRQPKSFWSRMLPRARPALIRGLYIYGGVGTGKTMLMDLFYNELPPWMPNKRVHFHDFMLSVHTKLQKHQGERDPVAAVAEDVAKESTVLCLDEFMITDVADAMILNRLFTLLFNGGVVLVATSNRPPERLYENGLQRELFVPFIRLLCERCVVHEVLSPTDYRRLSAVQQGTYFVGADSWELLWAKVELLTGKESMQPTSAEVQMGRTVQVPLAANGLAFFHFAQLCELPLGAADFIALANNFHTIVVEEIPILGASNRSAAYRFVTLIDVMYEHKTRLVCTAEGSPFELFAKVFTFSDAPKSKSGRSQKIEEADMLVDNELGFAKDRTISRLTEMQTRVYEDHHKEAYKKIYSNSKD